MALGSEISQHHHNPDEVELPAILRSNQARNHTTLDVQGMEGLLQVAQVALDFDNEERPGLRIPGQHVHRAAIAVVVERILDHGLPAKPRQPPDHRLDERRMSPIDLSLDRRTPKRPRREWQLDPDGSSNRASHTNGEFRNMTVFDARDCACAHAGQNAQIRLSQPEAAPFRSDPDANSKIVHARRVAPVDLPGLSLVFRQRRNECAFRGSGAQTQPRPGQGGQRRLQVCGA